MDEAPCHFLSSTLAATLLRLFLICGLVSACGHGVDIEGKGDIVSRAGVRHCMLEDEPCSFLIIEAYKEVYIPLPRPGWEFSHWTGCPVAERECAFDISAEIVQQYWFQDMPFLIAHFVRSDSDQDGVVDNEDAFPLEPSETKDSDCDGLGDNVDTRLSDNVYTLRGKRCGSGLHLYVLGDGYTADEQSKLLNDANRFVGFALDDEGIRSYLQHWNIHVVQTVSAESGVDKQFGVDEVDSAFGSGFSCSGIQRLICADDTAVLKALIEVSNDAQALAILLVNSDQYGGSGGTIPVFSSQSPEIALHEMGHSFAGLADEYIDAATAAIRLPYWQEGRYPNATRFNDPRNVPWSHWVDNFDDYPSLPGVAGVGLFEGAYYHRYGFYRPLSTSRMLSNLSDFGPVNSEAWILENYRRSSPVVGVTPEEPTLSLVTGEYLRFSVDIQFDGELQRVSWLLDGVDQGLVDRKHFLFGSEAPGNHTVTVKIRDVSGRIRQDEVGYSNFDRTWTIAVRGRI